MTLTETALAFARECLGWRDAKVLTHEPDAESPRLVVMSARAKADTLFAVTDLRDVEATVRGWCTANGLESTLSPGQPATATISRQTPAGDNAKVGTAEDPNPCQALLAACIDAHRKLRG